MSSHQAPVNNYHPIYHNAIYNNASSTRLGGREVPDWERDIRIHVDRYAVRSASWDAAERGDPPICHPDTRTAIQDGLGIWPDDPDGGAVKLISGWAGTGKTTIAQTMAEYWAKQGRLLGSFFFSRSSKGRSDEHWFEETILHQFFKLFSVSILKYIYTTDIFWSDAVNILSLAFPLSQPMVIVVDGLDECTNHFRAAILLARIFLFLHRLSPHVKFLISCHPEQHLEEVFTKFADVLGPSYRITLAQSPADNNDLRTFLRASFDRICHDRRKHGAMSASDGIWPSSAQIEELVDRASGQFVYVATLIAFVDDDNEDPVKLLSMVLEYRSRSFERIDALYVVILKKVETAITSSPHLHQLMYDLLLHTSSQPFPASDIAQFWFTEEVKVNILMRHLQAVLVRHQTVDDPIQFRHKSLHDFLVRPSSPHPFSIAAMNSVSKFFFSFRTLLQKAADRLKSLRGSQWLGYSFLYHNDRQLIIWPYNDIVRRLHQEYTANRPVFRGCECTARLLGALGNTSVFALHTFTSCGHDCIITSEFLDLTRRISLEAPVDAFMEAWERRRRSVPIFFGFLASCLWVRVILYGLLDPLPAFYGTTQVLVQWSDLNQATRRIASVHLIVCFMVWINTRWEVLLFLHLSHLFVSFLLRRFLRIDIPRSEPGERHPPASKM